MITYYSQSLQEEILARPAGFLGRYLRYSDRMEVYGPDLGMPHTRAMGEGDQKCLHTKNLRLAPLHGQT